jgi:hypothetical protein
MTSILRMDRTALAHPICWFGRLALEKGGFGHDFFCPDAFGRFATLLVEHSIVEGSIFGGVNSEDVDVRTSVFLTWQFN